MEEKLIVFGIDLSDSGTQLSFYLKDSLDAETFCVSEEEESFLIPTAAFLPHENASWLFGAEAVNAAKEEGTEAETCLFSRATELIRSGDYAAENSVRPITGSKASSDPVWLLGQFISWLLKLPKESKGAKCEALVISHRDVTEDMPEVFGAALLSAGLEIPTLRYVSYSESFFYYAMNQPVELWRYGVLLYDFDCERFIQKKLIVDQSTRPAIVSTVEEEFQEMLPFNGRDRAELDRTFKEITERAIGKTALSSVYLTGRAFEKRWENETLRFLCMRTRVFKGQNLYSKGACFAAISQVAWNHLESRYIFLDKDSLRQNISLRVISNGKEDLLSLIDAGVSWYNAYAEKEVLLGEERELILVISDMKGPEERNVVLRLDWLPKRPERASRILIRLSFSEYSKLEVNITDLGFGDLFPSTGLTETEYVRMG